MNGDRDLASLRGLGFTKVEIPTVLLGEMAVQVFPAIPIGLWIGHRLCLGIASTVDPEMLRLPVDIVTVELGDRVVVYPADRVEDGVRFEER